jgi:hypothetical protein
MRKAQFVVGEQFYTASGLWVCTAISDTEIRAENIWTYSIDGKNKKKNSSEVTFNSRHWPACRTEGPDHASEKRTLSNRRKVPCYRCYRDDLGVPYTILSLGTEDTSEERIHRGTVTVVCEPCRHPDEESCIRFGKYKWICPCGANIWQDDPKTDFTCMNCGRERGFLTPVEDR